MIMRKAQLFLCGFLLSGSLAAAMEKNAKLSLGALPVPMLNNICMHLATPRDIAKVRKSSKVLSQKLPVYAFFRRYAWYNPEAQNTRKDINAAIQANDFMSVVHFITQGVRVAQEDLQGWTPIHRAAYAGKPQMLDLLCSLCPNFDALHSPNIHGAYPLHLAAKNGHADCLNLLLNKYGGSNDQSLDMFVEGYGAPLYAAVNALKEVAPRSKSCERYRKSILLLIAVDSEECMRELKICDVIVRLPKETALHEKLKKILQSKE